MTMQVKITMNKLHQFYLQLFLDSHSFFKIAMVGNTCATQDHTIKLPAS